MTRIAFIGLGIMGSPMAVNLVNAGHDVIATTRTLSRGKAVAEAGGSVVTSVREAVHDAEVVITMLPDSPDVQEVVLGEDGVLTHASPGTLLVDMSTIRPTASRAIAVAAAERGVMALDAPVSGGEQGAIEATLSIMVGGEPAGVERARPVFEALGTTVVHVGPSGSGQIVKAANQLIVAGNIQLLAEALVLIDAHGVDQSKAIDVLGGGLAGSTVLDRKSAAMLAGNFAPGFRVDLHHKDLGIVQEAAREVGVATPLGSLTGILLGALRAQGDGGLDHSALIRGVQRLSGR